MDNKDFSYAESKYLTFEKFSEEKVSVEEEKKKTTLTKWEIKDTGIKKICEAHFADKIYKIHVPTDGNLVGLATGEEYD